MTFNDLKNFTCGEISAFTLGQLQLDKFELLKLAASGEINLPDVTWQKLCDLCRQTVSDFNTICPNNHLETPANIPVAPITKLTPEQIMEIITFIITVITFIRGVLAPQESISNITINNVSISIEEQEQLQYDLDEILKYLPIPEEV